MLKLVKSRKFVTTFFGVTAIAAIVSYMNLNESALAARQFLLSNELIKSRYGEVNLAFVQNIRDISATPETPSYKKYRFLLRANTGFHAVTIRIDGWPEKPLFSDVSLFSEENK